MGFEAIAALISFAALVILWAVAPSKRIGIVAHKASVAPREALA
ncbi:MAG: hypothetical protein QOF51_1836 [Chloroflexota bacterium]|jgi:hypothetical protein|nr:hypothetical protein [Chloroflexota bacterium]